MTEPQFQKRRVKLLSAPYGQKRKAQRKLIRMRTKMLSKELAQ